jgi:hypothetical protein
MKRSDLKSIVSESVKSDVSGKSHQYILGYRLGMSNYFDKEKTDINKTDNDFKEGYKKGYSSARWQKWNEKITSWAAATGNTLGSR